MKTELKSGVKYGVPAVVEFIVAEWRKEIAELLNVQENEFQDTYKEIFNSFFDELRIELMDGSIAHFRHANYAVSTKKRAIAIFTEHCGYHVFPFFDAKIFSGDQMLWAQKNL